MQIHTTEEEPERDWLFLNICSKADSSFKEHRYCGFGLGKPKLKEYIIITACKI